MQLCHGGGLDQFYKYEVREATGSYGVNMRHCSYCGSLNPEDLLTVLEAGAVLELADMKYGWPHKFYVSNIRNPRAGEIVEMGGRSWTGEDGAKHYEPFMKPAPQTLTLKFYNEHLLEIQDTELFDKVTNRIAALSGLRFFMQDEQLYAKRETR